MREPVTLNDGDTKHTWKDLDKTDKDGNLHRYTVDEVETPRYYGKSISEDGLTITNTYRSPVTDIVGRKVWIGGPEEKPTIQLQLFRNNIAYLDPVTLDGEVEHIWKNLNINNNAGAPYNYTVKEIGVLEDYEKLEDALTVTNTYVIPKIEVTGTKVWMGGPEERPTIELQLFRNNETFGEPITLESGVTEHTWTDLDKTDENGKEYDYTVDEVETPKNFGKSISEDGRTITNT